MQNDENICDVERKCNNSYDDNIDDNNVDNLLKKKE